MNEPETFNPSLLKSLFAQLVKAVGKQDAAAARLVISRQRVGQLCSANPEHARDIPTWDQVWTLEEGLGRSVVFQGLADMIDPPTAGRNACVLKESHDLVQRAADLLPLAAALNAKTPGAKEAFLAGLDALRQEAVEAESAASNVTAAFRMVG